jgi:hypothetical protein
MVQPDRSLDRKPRHPHTSQAVVVDSQVAFTGGAGVADHWLDTRRTALA